MDALDARILRELGMEPFVAWRQRVRGLRAADVAEALGVGVQLVKDRIARMTQDGVIVGYRLGPNLRHCGLDQTVFHVQSRDVPTEEGLGQLKDVDGFMHVVWFLDSGLCINLAHGSEGERHRRMQLVSRLVGHGEPPRVFYAVDPPHVQRSLTPLDWRIIHAMADDARRPIRDVAQGLGVTAKTVRNRLASMREQGSIDEVAALDFSKMQGIIPFEIAVWYQPDADPEDALLRLMQERLFAAFHPPADHGYCSLLLRVFAYTPADVQALLRETLDVPGVARVEPLMATGGMENRELMRELLEAQVAPVP